MVVRISMVSTETIDTQTTEIFFILRAACLLHLPFKLTKWVVTYFQCSVLWVIHTFHVSVLSWVCSWQSFLSFSRLCFPLIASFAGQKLFKFHSILLVTSCFNFLICETSFPKVLTQHHVLKYLPCFPLKVPTLRFNIKVFGPFWISFCMWWGILT